MFGLIIGSAFSLVIVKQLEIQAARYIYKMKFGTYFYTILLMTFFISITNIITHHFLKNIKLKGKEN